MQILRVENAIYENAGHEMQDLKMLDTKIEGMKQ